jgi:hypothetical protein
MFPEKRMFRPTQIIAAVELLLSLVFQPIATIDEGAGMAKRKECLGVPEMIAFSSFYPSLDESIRPKKKGGK